MRSRFRDADESATSPIAVEVSGGSSEATKSSPTQTKQSSSSSSLKNLAFKNALRLILWLCVVDPVFFFVVAPFTASLYSAGTTEEWDLFKGTVVKGSNDCNDNDNGEERRKVYLVISHCKNELGWISSYCRDFEDEIAGVTIISKCDKEVVGLPSWTRSKVDVIRLTNIGRCDYNFAYIFSNITSSQPILPWSVSGDSNDIVVLLKDDMSSDALHQRGKWQSLEDMLKIAQSSGFACGIKPFRHYAMRLWGLSMEEESAYAVTSEQDVFSMASYRSEHGTTYDDIAATTSENAPFKSAFANLGEWRKDLNLSIPNALAQVCYGGSFAVTKKNIRRHPDRVWLRLLKALSRGDNIEEGHFAERSWAALLSNPLPERDIAALMEYSTIVERRLNYEGVLLREVGVLPWIIWVPFRGLAVLLLEMLIAWCCNSWYIYFD